MLPQWIIEKKRDGSELTAADIGSFIDGYTCGEIPDYQMAALAMAVFFRGMTPAETATLARAMLKSGGTLDTSLITVPKIDKHSTGGVGDKVSLVLAPLVACCGVAVPMLSGRGLGITGGTLDKLESIPGYRTQLTEAEFMAIVSECGCSIMGQTDRLAPADRKLYALRDVTGTVPSIPLIVASILSKKAAEGIDGVVFDVKCGSGAFMKSMQSARDLSVALLRTADEMGLKASALITDMSQPIGHAVGNALEVAECLETLRGAGPSDLRRLTLTLSARMLVIAGVEKSDEAAMGVLARRLDSGEALDRFRQMVRLHGGDTACVDDPWRLPSAPLRADIPSPADGVVCEVNAEALGRCCVEMGAGRRRTADTVDPSVGVAGIKKIGDTVAKGEALAVVHAATRPCLETAVRDLSAAFRIGSRSTRPGAEHGDLVLEDVRRPDEGGKESQ